MNTIHVRIGGMHCAACSQAVRQAALSFESISEAKVDLKKGTLSLILAAGPATQGGLPAELEAKLRAKIEELGYAWKEAKAEDALARVSPFVRFGAPALSVIAFAAFIALESSGALARFFSNFSPALSGQGDFSAANALSSAGAAFAMGLIASGSSCLAVVGSVVIGFSGLYGDKRTLRPNLLFQGARVATFIILGAVLGLAGNAFTNAFDGSAGTFVTAILQTILGLILLASAAMILGNKTVSGFVSRLLPAGVTRFFARLAQSESPFAPLILGALTFFLPCGFTQTAQAQALASANPALGAIILGSFALGTLPVLLAAGVSVSWSRSKGKGFFTRFAGFLVALLALWTIASGIALLGAGQGSGRQGTLAAQEAQAAQGTAPGEPAQVTSQKSAEHTIEMRVKYEGFLPRELDVPAGKEIEWIIWGDEVTGCTNAIVVPALGLRFKVLPGKNVIRFRAPDKPGRIDYSCWMGMVRARLVVVEK